LEYNVGTDTWTILNPMLGERARMNGGVIGCNFYVVGGRSNEVGSFDGTPDNFVFNCPCPTPTPTPSAFAISGTVGQCNTVGPSGILLPGVTMTLTGTSSGSTTTEASGNYSFPSLAAGGNYTITPSKATRPPGTTGINTTDVLAVQRHFLGIGTPLSGCRLTAADCAPPVGITTADVIAIQRYFLSLSTGIANVGKYGFNPVNRSYTPLTSNQTGQNYDTVVFGDVATPFAFPRPDGDPAPETSNVSSDITVTLPEMTSDQSKSSLIGAVKVSAIDPDSRLVGFQGDMTFDERVVNFENQPVQNAGLTAGNWNVSANVLPGKGPMRTLRISAYSTDFAPLSGAGTLFELRMVRANNAQSARFSWMPGEDHFIFIDADLTTHTVLGTK
jgi:hypothetical protein